MEKITVAELMAYAGANSDTKIDSDFINRVTIDSRDASENSAFFAIVGENSDGHAYLKGAYDRGCRVFVVNKGNKYIEDIRYLEGVSILEVENTELALGRAAGAYRGRFNVRIIGITGSVGKTTTRDFVYSVLSVKFKTLKNEKNLNNQLGVPLTLFNLDSSYECAVIEMGMDTMGDIDYLDKIVKQDAAIISNIGLSHVERLGSQENIFKGKMEIAKYFNEDNILIVNSDDKFLSTIDPDSTVYSVMQFGYNSKDIACTGYEIKDGGIEFYCDLSGPVKGFFIPTKGEHNIYNALSAICAGLVFGLNINEIKTGLANFKATGMRQQILDTGIFTIINDAYNASPDSMKAALTVLSTFFGRKVAILGDMFEMGDFNKRAHETVGEFAKDKVDVLIAVGKNAEFIYNAALKAGMDRESAYYFEDVETLNKGLDELVRKHDVILVKASRGMRLERVVELLEGKEVL